MNECGYQMCCRHATWVYARQYDCTVRFLVYCGCTPHNTVFPTVTVWCRSVDVWTRNTEREDTGGATSRTQVERTSKEPRSGPGKCRQTLDKLPLSLRSIIWYQWQGSDAYTWESSHRSGVALAIMGGATGGVGGQCPPHFCGMYPAWGTKNSNSTSYSVA